LKSILSIHFLPIIIHANSGKIKNINNSIAFWWVNISILATIPIANQIILQNEIPFVTHEYFQRAKLSESSNKLCLFAAIRGFLYFIRSSSFHFTKVGFQRTSK